jgi:hypothetical protein
MSIELPHTNFFINNNGAVYYDGGLVVNDGNYLYQAYLEWVSEGNTPELWEEHNAVE